VDSDKEKLARFMMEHGFATGHGDTFDDLLLELGWQINELLDKLNAVDGGNAQHKS
jgi:hypothetical protein